MIYISTNCHPIISLPIISSVTIDKIIFQSLLTDRTRTRVEFESRTQTQVPPIFKKVGPLSVCQVGQGQDNAILIFFCRLTLSQTTDFALFQQRKFRFQGNFDVFEKKSLRKLAQTTCRVRRSNVHVYRRRSKNYFGAVLAKNIFFLEFR